MTALSSLNRRLMPLLLIAAPFVFAQQAVPAPQAPVTLPPATQFVTSVEGINEYRLANGLRVLLFPDPTKSNITVNATYMVGSRHEDYGETGMAHLLEHLLFMGSKNHPDIKKELTDHGTRPNGSTWLDRTNYFETFTATPENLKWAIELEADRMVNSFIAKKDLDSEMTVVRNEYESGENNPQGILMQRTMSTAYLWHNYGKSTIGARSDLENVPIERLQAFYRHFYQPDNAILVVAGKFDEASTLALIQKTFGVIPKPTRPLRKTYTIEPVQDGERAVVLRRVGDIQALSVAYHIPSGLHEDYAAIEVATDILGDQPSGRLYKALVETKKAAEVFAFSFQLMDPGITLAMATVREEQSLADARKIMLETFDTLKAHPFTEEEVNRSKTQYQKAHELAMNNSERVALELSEWQAMGDWRMMFLHRDRVRKVTLEQVQKAADKYFVPSNRTVGEFIPDKTPLRAEIPAAPDVAEILKGYKGDAAISKGEEFDASPSNIDKRTIRGDLAGGLKLSFITKKTRGEQVNVSLRLHFGDVDSLQNKQRIGSLTNEMLMRGTTKHTRQQIKDEFDRLKAQVSVRGDASAAVVSIQTTKPNLSPVLDLVAEILKSPSFPESEFETLKQQSLADIESQKSEPQAMAVIAMRRHMNPYPKGDIRYVPTLDEEIEEIKSTSLDSLKTFHKDFYGASASEIAVIGDFDPETLQKQLSTLFNDWKSPRKFARVSRPYRPVEPEVKTLEAPDKENSMWIASLPIKMKDSDPDYPALALGNYLLGSSMGSRLFARIRSKEGLSYGVGSQITAHPVDDSGGFMSYAISAPQNTPKVEASIKDEVTNVLEKGYTAEEVEAAKKSWSQQRQVSRANDRELVGKLAEYRYFDRTMAFDAEMEAKVMALTPAQIQAAMKKYIDLSKLSIYRAGDFKKAKATF